MDLGRLENSESRFAGYVRELASVIGHKDREGPLRDYCVGLLLPCERKSVEPMAAVTAPDRTAAQHQSLLHFVGEGRWSDEPVLAKVREMVLPRMQQRGAIEAWIIDDTSFPKQGRHSVGVARQYCGQLGKEDNCQVAVSLSVANGHASLPVAYRLYLPQEWAQDRDRLRKAGVPEDIGFKTKHEIALDQLHWACAVGLPRGVEQREPTARMAADRVAQRGERTDQVLAFDPSRGHRLPSPGGPRQAALAHRTRLSRTQTGGRSRTLRRPQMARLPSPRHAVHRRLRIPDLRAGDDSPLRSSFRRALLAAFSSPRLPTPRSRHCGLSDISPTRSRPCDGD